MNARQRCIAILVIGSLSALGTDVRAAHDDDPDSPFYKASELSLDLFGTGSIGQSTINNLSGDRVEEDVRLGLGAGLNYFFTRHIGLGGEAYSENAGHSFIDSASLNLIGRLPLGTSGVAPYLFVGGGYQFDEIERWLLNLGGGFEFRFQKNWGLFIDARYVFTDETKNYGLGRAGVRLSF